MVSVSISPSSSGFVLERFVTELKSAPPQKEFLLLPELTIIPRKFGEFVTEASFDGAYDFSAMTVREVFGKDQDVGKLSFIAREAKQFYPFPRTMMRRSTIAKTRSFRSRRSQKQNEPNLH